MNIEQLPALRQLSLWFEIYYFYMNVPAFTPKDEDDIYQGICEYFIKNGKWYWIYLLEP